VKSLRLALVRHGLRGSAAVFRPGRERTSEKIEIKAAIPSTADTITRVQALKLACPA